MLKQVFPRISRRFRVRSAGLEIWEAKVREMGLWLGVRVRTLGVK
jgi:hypothetical protein